MEPGFSRTRVPKPTTNKNTTMAKIPASDPGFNTWFLNFKTPVVANPTNYGLVAGDATAINAKWTTWAAAYAAATNILTKNPATVAAKDNARADALLTIRPYTQMIENNAAVSDVLKIGAGLTVRPDTLTPVPAPTTFPALQLRAAFPGQMELQYQDSGTGEGKAKPDGVVSIQLKASIGTAPGTDPDTAPDLVFINKSPRRVNWPTGTAGKVGTIWGRYMTRSGPGGDPQFGPWSTPLIVTVT